MLSLPRGLRAEVPQPELPVTLGSCSPLVHAAGWGQQRHLEPLGTALEPTLRCWAVAEQSSEQMDWGDKA